MRARPVRPFRSLPVRSLRGTRSRTVAVLVALFAGTGAAVCDDDVSPGEAWEVRAALAEIGCTVREVEFDDGFYEADDARCPGGIYDIKLNRYFEIVSVRRD